MEVINKYRVQHDYSAAKLRKARRLYFFIVSKHIPDGIVGVQTVCKISERLQERGYYSNKTNIKDIYFRCYRSMYKHTKERHEDWFEWLLKRGYSKYPWKLKVA